MREETRKPSFFHSSHFGATLWYTALVGAVSIAFCLFIYASQARAIEDDGRSRVAQKMNDATHRPWETAEITLPEGDACAVFDLDGSVLRAVGLTAEKAASLAARAATQADAASAAEPGRHGRPVAWVTDTPGGNMLYAYTQLSAPREAGGGPSGWLLYGSPLDPYGLRGRLLVTLLIAVAFMLASAIASGAWLANRAMRPVARMAHTARSIGEGDLSRRIGLGTRDELGELSTAFDAMLDRLQAAFDRQRTFVADAGHELRTPLSIIQLETERALSAERSAGDYRQSLSVVRAECAHMAKLVDELLLLARVDSAEAVRGYTAVDLGDVVTDALERLAPLAARRGVALAAADLPEAVVRGDRTSLSTMVGNLVDNAVKYSRLENGRVEVSLRVEAGRAVIRVSDNGPGIPPEKLGRIFDRFYRVDEARSDVEGRPAGSGLGLAIVKAISEAHGGKVDVASNPGSGSQFTVTLPLAGAS